MSNPNIKEILKVELKERGFDGLFNEGICGCLIDDLMPCDEPSPYCQAGYKQPGDEDADWYVGPQKPKD